MDPIRILLVDDHKVVRAGFQQLLSDEPLIQVIAEASNGQEAFEQYKAHTPDVAIMDLSMPCDSSSDEATSINGGIEAIRRIMAYDAKARILVLTVWENEPYPSHVIDAGVTGYLTKRCAPDELVEAVMKVSKGEQYFSEAIRSQISGDSRQNNPLQQLTKRELQIFCLLAEGRKTAQIADEMYLSPKTVHAHRSNIVRKLDIKTNQEIVHLALHHGLLQS